MLGQVRQMAALGAKSAIYNWPC